jgi:hypothetical protein
LKKLQSANPDWNKAVVGYRLDYLGKKIAPLRQIRAALGTVTTNAAPPVAVNPATVAAAPPELQEQLRALVEQVRQAQAERGVLEAKLKEALTSQPAMVDAREVAKAEEKIRALQKDNDLLQVSVAQEKARMAKMVEPAALESMQKSLDDVNQKLAKQTDVVSALSVEKEATQKRLKEEQDRAAKMADPVALEAAQKALAEANKKVAIQSDTAAALALEKETLEKKLRAEQERAARMVDATAVEEMKRQLADSKAQVTKQTEFITRQEADSKSAMEELNRKLAEQTKAMEAASAENAAQMKKLSAARAIAEKEAIAGLSIAEATRKDAEVARSAADAAGAKLEETQKALAALRSEKEALQKSLKDKAPETALMASLERENAALKKQTDESKQQADKLTRQQAETAALLASVRTEQAGTAKLLEEQRGTVAALTREKEALQKSMGVKGADDARLKTLEGENTTLKQELASLRERADRSAKQVEGVGAQLASAQKDLVSLRAGHEALQQEKQLLEGRLKAVASAPVPSNLNASETEKQLAASRLSVLATEAQVAALQKEKMILEKARADAEARLAAAGTDSSRLRNLDLEKLRQLEHDLVNARAAAQLGEIKLADAQKDRTKLETRAAALVSEREADLSRRGSETRRLKELERERDELQAKLNASSKELYAMKSKPGQVRAEDLNEQISTLRARLAVFEARQVPYTKEEQALFKRPDTQLAGFEKQRKAVKPLPPAAGTLVLQAQRDAASGRLPEAEEKFQEVLRQDDKHLYTLVNLAGVQLEQNKPAEAEKTLQQALATEPGDAGALYLLGVLRVQQERVDDAIDALGKSAKSRRRRRCAARCSSRPVTGWPT